MATIFPNIKERILQFVEYKGIAKEFFFEKIGVTYGNFKGKAKQKALSSDTLATIVTSFPDLNATWVLTGNGPMIKENAPPAPPNEDYNKLKDEIAILRKEIESLLKDKVDLLNRIVNLQDESHNKSHQHTNIRTKSGKLKSN